MSYMVLRYHVNFARGSCKIKKVDSDGEIHVYNKVQNNYGFYIRQYNPSARRSFCTNEYLAGMLMDLIMAISGHKSETAFRKYIKVDQLKKVFMIKNCGMNGWIVRC